MKPARSMLVAVASMSLVAGAPPPPSDGPVARPTGPSVPANLLRLSIAFDQSPEGPVLPKLSLVREDGSVIEEPFLEHELWAPDGRVLTVLMHPGRVKTGLDANERLGRALIPGQTASLTYSGHRIGRWTIGSPDHAPPDPRRWRVSVPQQGTREAVTVGLDAPVDALGADLIAVRDAASERVEGTTELLAGETAWRFTPRSAWQAARYVVVASPELEDPSGNRPGQSFEHSPGAEPQVPDGPAFVPINGRERP